MKNMIRQVYDSLMQFPELTLLASCWTWWKIWVPYEDFGSYFVCSYGVRMLEPKISQKFLFESNKPNSA